MNNKIRNTLLASVLALLATASNAATVVLENHSSAVAVGDNLLVDVVLQDPFSGGFAGDELLAFGFDLNYDNTAFALRTKTVGSLWDDDTPFLNVGLAGSVFPSIPDDGSNSPILLGQLYFTALTAGTFTLGVVGNALQNPNLGLIYLGGEGNILAQTLVNVAPVPLPAAGWLLGSGLFALFGLRRRR